jgi:hypothetical protein
VITAASITAIRPTIPPSTAPKNAGVERRCDHDDERVRHERVEDREHGAEQDRGASRRLGGNHEADGRERGRRYQENERRVSEGGSLDLASAYRFVCPATVLKK